MANNIYQPSYVKDLFNRMSNSYERMNYITSFGFSLRWRRQFLHPFKPSTTPIQALDLLTGMGEMWFMIKKRLPNASLTALDFSEGMLRYAKAKNERHFQGKITILEQDVLKNDLQSDYYDIITCAFGLKTFNEEQLVVLATEIKRILKVGGAFSFIEVSKPDNQLLSFFYGFYLGKIIPILGKLMLGDPAQYKMLWEYTSEFKNAQKAATIFADAGLEVNYYSYFYGCATGFYGQKKAN